MASNDKKAFVVLGGFTHEGLTTKVEALGYRLVSLALDKVGSKTWIKRAEQLRELRESDRLVAIVIYLHTTLLLKASSQKFRDEFDAILTQARSLKTIIFVFQDNLDGLFTIRHFETRQPMTLEELQKAAEQEKWETSRNRLEKAIERFIDYQDRRDEISSLLGSLYDSGAEGAPFFVRSDVTMRLEEFLEDIEQGVFLRLYVPNDRLQADQLKGLLSVLERYLRQVEGQNFSIDSHKSEHGVTYVFRSRTANITFQGLADAFVRFDSFMRLCGDDPSQAVQVLQEKGVNNKDATHFVEKYARDYRRLVLDTRHEFERKTLILKQRLETEVLDLAGESPTITQSNEGLSSVLQIAAGGNVAINIDNVSLGTKQNIRAEVAQIVNGVSYNENDKQLLALFQNHSQELEALQYRSDLDQLKDPSAPELTRQNSKQRLSAFLRKAAHKAGDVAQTVAVEALSKYLESLLRSGA